MTHKTLVVGVVVAALTLGACGSDKKGATGASTPKPGAGGFVVHTVPSLKTVVTALVTAFNKTHPKVHFTIVVENPAIMKKAVAKPTPQLAIDGNALKAAVKGSKTGKFGRNFAVIAVAPTNPHHVTDLKAFAAGSGLKTKVCGAKTIIGNFTALVLRKAKIKPDPSTLAFDCEAKALADVAANKLDAVLMFRAGHKVPSGVKVIPVPDAQNILIPVSYAVIGSSPRLAVFERYLATGPARTVLTQAGYLP